MTYNYITACYHPTYSVLYGLWEKKGKYYISPDLCRRTPASTRNQYMLFYKPLPDTIYLDRETIQDPQQLTDRDIRNKFVLYKNNKWFFDEMIK